MSEAAVPRLSVVVVAYNMARELPRTLQTLSARYQQGIAAHDFEVLVLDNGSSPPVEPGLCAQWQAWPGQFRLLRVPDAHPSPVAAINLGLAQARGTYVGVMIDGARMCSPGLLRQALQACVGVPGAVVGALGWYLGPDFQRQAMQRGYNQQREDALLARVDWQHDGYRLYDIACMDESSQDGWYAPVAEFNALFMHRERWQHLGGYDPGFDMPGGGLANLDMCKRALELPDSQGVLLRGEATFHQVHGGTATNTPVRQAIADWERWCVHYEQLRGQPYQPPRPTQPVLHFGHLPQQVRLHYLRALAFAPQSGRGALPPLGADFDWATWAMPAAVWQPGQAADAPPLAVQQAVAALLAHALRQGDCTEVLQVCRWLYEGFPLWRAPSHLLALLAPWLPHGQPETVPSSLLLAVQALLEGRQRPAHALVALPADFSAQPPVGSTFGFPMTATSSAPAWLLHPAALLEPLHFSHPAPWAGHIPFAGWLLAMQQPRTLVELGTYSGISYLAMCQAIAHNRLATRAWAVDTWEGDAHAGAYDERIYNSLRRAHDPHYSRFSTLLRMTFDEAQPLFADGSVDLLHIDGLHTYEAVRHDFETWLPKLSERGVVLFHDTHVYRDDFGVHRLWAELSGRYPSLHFSHSNGLGVLLVGAQQPQVLLQLCDTANAALQQQAQAWFASLGASLERRAEVLMLEIQLHDAEYRAAHEYQAGQQRHAWIEKQDATLLQLNQQLQQTHQQFEQARHQLQQRDGQLADALQHLQQRDGQLTQAQRDLQAVYQSRSWRVTAGLRAVGGLVRRTGLGKLLRHARNALRYVARGDFAGLGQRARQLRRERQRHGRLNRLQAGGSLEVGILATEHTQFVAHALHAALQRIGLQVQMVAEPQSPRDFPLDYYIVICPQMFENLPPGHQRIVWQMEQGVSSRWFTPQYVQMLENSLAVLEYAQANFPFLEEKGLAYPHVFFLPVGALPDYSAYLKAPAQAAKPQQPEYDVIFYGDTNSPRRQVMLKALEQQFKLRMENNLFGARLHEALRSARVVVNIHYYEGALLETTRIYECLSLGLPVVSEESVDLSQHPDLLSSQAISFSPMGDAQALVQAVAGKLQQLEQEPDAVHQGLDLLRQESHQQFTFMLYRMLYALKLLSHAQWEEVSSGFSLPADRLVLGLPETWQRRQNYLKTAAPVWGAEVQWFDGLRYTPGWMGCALSYQYLARKALQMGWQRLEVSEDDVVLPEGCLQRREKIHAWLDAHPDEWDIFSGLIAQVHPDTQVLAVHEYEGQQLVVIDRMVSTVHNVYAPGALKALAAWNPHNTDAENNTIDRHLQNYPNLRVVVALPFMVGHDEGISSSLWGFGNEQYSQWIAEAQGKLYDLCREFSEKPSES